MKGSFHGMGRAEWSLVLLPAAAYLFALWGDFVYDDVSITVLQNPVLLGTASWKEIFTWDRPLRELTYLLDHALWGFHPLGYHIQNLLWHGVNALLVFILLQRLGVSRPLAWASALLFALHPVNTEAVAWISGRKELLCLFFELCACVAWLRAFPRVAESLPVRSLWSLASLAALVLALLSKQVAVMLPFLLLLCEAMAGRMQNSFSSGSSEISTPASSSSRSAGWMMHSFRRWFPWRAVPFLIVLFSFGFYF